MRPPRSTDHERGGTETWGFVATAAFLEWTGRPSASAQGPPSRRALRPPSQQNSHSPSCTFQMEEFHLMRQSPGMAGRGVGRPWDGGAGVGTREWRVSVGDGGPGGKALLHKPMLILPSAPSPPKGPEASDQERTSADSSDHCSGPQLTLTPEHPRRHSVHQTP